jgi:DNA-binding LacI/PurR family transcriptional regulator
MAGFEAPSGKSAAAGPTGRVTLRDIAEAVGVSISTASRALNGAPGMSVDVRSRIQSAAERLNYVGAFVGTATVISDLQVPDGSAGEFILAVQRGMEKRARELGLALSVTHAGPSSMAWLDPDEGTSGYLLLSMQSEDIIQNLSSRAIPAVIVNGREPLMRLDAVAPANHTGGYLGARHLLQLGHTRILVLAHSPRPTIRDRMAGSRRAMQEMGLETNGDLVVELEAMRTDLAYKAIRERIAASARLPQISTAIRLRRRRCSPGGIERPQRRVRRRFDISRQH